MIETRCSLFLSPFALDPTHSVHLLRKPYGVRPSTRLGFEFGPSLGRVC